jgi:hypothetical protein
MISVSASEIDQVPLPFLEPLNEALRAEESVHRLIFSPEFTTFKERRPASVLCVTNSRWLMALKEQSGTITIRDAVFNEILAIELTVILLHGKLKIDFARNAQCQSTALYFNTVAIPKYYAAVCEILGASSQGGSTSPDRKPSVRFPEWPHKFRNFAILYTPPASYLLDGAFSGAVYGRLFGEKATATAVLITERDLIIIAEEKSGSWFPPKDSEKYGALMTYIPRQRLIQWETTPGRRVDLHQLQILAGRGIQKFQFPLSPECRDHVRRISDQVIGVCSASAEKRAGRSAD